jgi:hypothetical protein
MAGETVRVNGLRETVRALDKVNRDAKKVVLAELASAAEPIAATARTKISRYSGASLATIKPRAATKGVFVRQNARKVSGLRADFGALQMTHGLLPALAEHANEIVPGLDRALGRLADSQNF